MTMTMVPAVSAADYGTATYDTIDMSKTGSLTVHKYDITADNCEEILQKEIGIVFTSILEQCGVYSRNNEGKAGFIKFIESVK